MNRFLNGLQRNPTLFTLADRFAVEVVGLLCHRLSKLNMLFDGKNKDYRKATTSGAISQIF